MTQRYPPAASPTPPDSARAPPRSPRLRRGLVVATLAGALGALTYGAVLLGVYWQQEALLFRPTRLPPDYRFALPDVVERSIAVDGATLSVLHLRLPDPAGVVFFLHGNGGNLATWFTSASFYRRVNFDLFMLDYRGYGKSTGAIGSEAQLRADVRAAWAVVADEYRDRRKVIYGRSLGTALAAGLGAEATPDLTILVSPYCTMGEVAALHYPWVPVALLRYPLSTCDDVGRLRGPLLLVHGDNDTLIPIEQSERVRARASAAELLRIPGAGHHDIHQFDLYTQTLAERLIALGRD